MARFYLGGLPCAVKKRISERFGNEQVLPAVDINGEHLYLSGEFAGDNCAMALAIQKLDPFDIARKTTYKDVAIALVNSRDGKVRFRQSIRNLFS